MGCDTFVSITLDDWISICDKAVSMARLDAETKARRLAVGSCLREERQRVGFSLQQLADRAGYLKMDIQRFEKGEKSITLEDLQRLCVALGDAHAAMVRDRLLDTDIQCGATAAA